MPIVFIVMIVLAVLCSIWPRTTNALIIAPLCGLGTSGFVWFITNIIFDMKIHLGLIVVLMICIFEWRLLKDYF